MQATPMKDEIRSACGEFTMIPFCLLRPLAGDTGRRPGIDGHAPPRWVPLRGSLGPVRAGRSCASSACTIVLWWIWHPFGRSLSQRFGQGRYRADPTISSSRQRPLRFWWQGYRQGRTAVPWKLETGRDLTSPSRYTQISVFLQLEKQIQAAFRESLNIRFGIDSEIVLEQPKQTSFGELAVPIAFQLARSLKQPPKKIAAELLEAVGDIPGVAAMEVAGNGYINLRLDRGSLAAGLLDPPDAAAPLPSAKTIVEHTNINPNKAAHIGHLRNAVLGDTFVRMLRVCGNRVEVQNYIDNTGVQVADVVAGFHFLEKKTPSDVAKLIAAPRFDYICWDLYARTSQYYKDHPEALAWRAEVLHGVEAGSGELAELGHLVADAIVNLHLATMLRLNIQYDVLPRESEILHLKFWASAFELLKERQAIYFEEEGKNSGCWVMPPSAFRGTDEANEDSKVIVRSNGTVTYVGKDIAYQLWKFGLLGKDFHYRTLIEYSDGKKVWVSTDQPQSGPDAEATPEFGRGQTVYNVIDTRQSYLQDVVVAGLRALGFETQANESIHFSYEMVALSPRCCADLGIELSEEDAKKPYVEVSGRKGLGVKADDLMDKLVETALQEVASRHPEDNEAAQLAIATEIAMGALRYFLLKFTRNTVIAFDFQEALSFEGETGPYVQYAAVRARNIFRKLEDRGEAIPDFRAVLTPGAMARQLAGDGNAELWQILMAAAKADSVVERAVTAGEPAHVAKYAFQLAQTFNLFYHQYPVLAEPDPERKAFLLWMTEYLALQLERTLAVLGIAVPSYM
jgi:arginyl-tRNA synthetase